MPETLDWSNEMGAYKPDNATQRVRVVHCINGWPWHIGQLGWRLEGDRVLVDDGQFMVRLDSGGGLPLLCVAIEVEVQP
jgi:hypothetical protein